jgi:hypothetical protein
MGIAASQLLSFEKPFLICYQLHSLLELVTKEGKIMNEFKKDS